MDVLLGRTNVRFYDTIVKEDTAEGPNIQPAWVWQCCFS